MFLETKDLKKSYGEGGYEAAGKCKALGESLV